MTFPPQWLSRFQPIAFALSLALCILGVRLLIIANFSENIPHDDPLIKECDWVLAPLIEGKPWQDRFLLPHNEHRIYLSLGTHVALTLWAGQWDGRAQAIISACLYAAIMAGLFLWSWNHLIGGARLVASLGLIVIGMNLVAWENIVWGFQSAFYFMIGLSLVALHGALFARAWTLRWWLSLSCGLAALVSLGSGLLWTIPVVLTAAAAAWWGPREERTRLLPSAVAAVGILALGWYLSYSPPWHAGMRAQTLGDFFSYLLHCLAWPQPHYSWLAAWWLAPSVALAISAIARRRLEPREILVFALFAWISLQILALAYSRGAGAGYPASRYGEILAFGLIIQIFMLGILWERFDPRFPWFRFGTAVWMASLAVGLGFRSRSALHDELPAYKAHLAMCVQNLKTYLVTGDAERFLAGPLPLPSSMRGVVKPVFDRPGMRRIMPVSVRPPLELSFSDHPLLYEDLPPELTANDSPDGPGRWGTYSGRENALTTWGSAICSSAGLSYWELAITGDVGVPGVELTLVSVASGQVIERVTTHAPSGEWKRVHLKVPGEPFRLVATSGAGRWLGWTNPVEVSWLSYWIKYALRRAWWPIFVGLALALGAGISVFKQHRSRGRA